MKFGEVECSGSAQPSASPRAGRAKMSYSWCRAEKRKPSREDLDADNAHTTMDWQASAEGVPPVTPSAPSAASSLKTHDIVRLLKLVDGNQHLFTTFAKLRQLVWNWRAVRVLTMRQITQRAVKVEEIPMDDKLYITLCRLYLEAIEFAEKFETCITSNLDPSLPRSFTVPKRKMLGGA